MCQKLKGCSNKIDPCMSLRILEINKIGMYKPIASCCGHDKYSPTIIIKDIKTDEIIEYFTLTYISNKPRKSGRYYRKDKNGYYYLPEVDKVKNIKKVEGTEWYYLGWDKVIILEDLGTKALKSKCNRRHFLVEFVETTSNHELGDTIESSSSQLFNIQRKKDKRVKRNKK